MKKIPTFGAWRVIISEPGHSEADIFDYKMSSLHFILFDICIKCCTEEPEGLVLLNFVPRLFSEGIISLTVAWAPCLIHTVTLTVGEGVRLVEVQLAERVCVNSGLFLQSIFFPFTVDLPLLWIILYVRSLHLRNMTSPC